jgi:effector-binding domain-containing protein
MKNMDTELQSRLSGKYYGYQINELPMNARHYLMSRNNVEADQVQMSYAQNLGALFTRVQNENILMDGKPSSLFFSENNTKGLVDMAAAIPLKARVDMANLTSISLPVAPVVTIEYVGDTKDISKGHLAARSYMMDRNFRMKIPYIEEYITDPLKEKDPNKWQTKIMYYYDIVK